MLVAGSNPALPKQRRSLLGGCDADLANGSLFGLGRNRPDLRAGGAMSNIKTVVAVRDRDTRRLVYVVARDERTGNFIGFDQNNVVVVAPILADRKGTPLFTSDMAEAEFLFEHQVELLLDYPPLITLER